MSTPGPPPEETIGAAFIGGVIQVFLVGLATVQTFIFFKTNTEVHFINKWAVFSLWVLIILHVISVIHVTFYYLVTKQGVLTGPLIWSFVAESVLELLLTNLTQILYAARLWQLTKGTVSRMLLFSVIGGLIGLNLALNVYIPLEISQVPGFDQLPHVSWTWAVKLDFSATSLIDFVLSIALVHSLAKTGKRLDWTDKSLDVILAYALNTGIFASFFSLTCPLAYSFLPNNMIFLALRIILTGLYVNSLLAMLNARYYFQKSNEQNVALNAVVPSQTSVLLYNGRGFDRQLHSAPATSTNKATINEIGLPLFQPREERHQVNDSIQLMEVKVTKERLAHDG